MVQRRLSKQNAGIISLNISITLSCGYTLMFCTKSLLPPLQLIRDPLPCTPDLRGPSSFCVDRSTHTGAFVNHYPLSTLFWIPPNSASDHYSTSSIEVVLQECRNTYTCLCILSIKSTPKRGSFRKSLVIFLLKAASVMRPHCQSIGRVGNLTLGSCLQD